MAQSMSIVQYRPQAPFPLILIDNRSLDPAGADNDPLQSLLVPLAQKSGVGGNKIEQLPVKDNPVFCRFRQSAPILAGFQRVEGRSVNEDQPRLIKGPDKVFPLDVVDSGLSP